jgi:type II secretory pathway pseudopilin PulG
MKNIYLARRGFTIIELAISLSAIMIIIGLASGAYFGIIKKSEEANIIKVATEELPKAILQYRLDVGLYPPPCGDGPQFAHLWLLTEKSKVATYGASSTTTLEELQARWRGPYFNPNAQFTEGGGHLKDENKYNSNSMTYCLDYTPGVAGKFGRTVDGGRDYAIVVNACGNSETGVSIYNQLGAEKAYWAEAPNSSECWWRLSIVFHQEFD